MQYLVREPTPKSPVRRATAQRQPSEHTLPHGLARRLSLRPLGWEPVVSLDGLRPIKLPVACVVTIEIEPDTQQWWQRVVLP